eukprot:TRINITY_DN5578_c0_g2_i1.p1 TRINITY_DN5578_c0_g2~~TRINITY_DN5578_c0_g2_i1.p1  ORF type:complete len:651 (+),score=161.03 TRINITY_DN5578_c0_g2_i1:205-2157(+)
MVAAEGWRLCVQLAARLEMPAVLESIMLLLARTLERTLDLSLSMQDMDTLLASHLTVRLAVKVFFEIATDHGHLLTAACWGSVVEQTVRLNHHGLVIQHGHLLGENSTEERGRALSQGGAPRRDTGDNTELNRNSSWVNLFTDPNHQDLDGHSRTEALALMDSCQVMQLFCSSSKFLSVESLVLLAKALQVDISPNGLGEQAGLLCLHLLVEVVLHNRDRFESVWPSLLFSIEKMLQPSWSTQIWQRVTAALMRLCSRLAHKSEIAVVLFDTIRKMFLEPGRDQSLLAAIQPQLAVGVLQIVQNNVLHINRTATSWQVIVDMIQLVATDSHGPISLAALEHVVLHSQPLSGAALTPCLSVLRHLLLNISMHDQAVHCSAVQLLLTVHLRLCDSQALQDPSVWPPQSHYVLELLADVCSSPKLPDPVGRDAISGFSSLLRQGNGSPLRVSLAEWMSILKTGLFPMLHQLQASATARSRMELGLEALERALLMVLPILVKEDGFDSIWQTALVVLAGFSRLRDPLLDEVMLVLGQLLAVLGELRGPQVLTSDLWQSTVEVLLALCGAGLELSEEGLEKMLGVSAVLPAVETDFGVGPEVGSAGEAEGEEAVQSSVVEDQCQEAVEHGVVLVNSDGAEAEAEIEAEAEPSSNA